MIISLMAAATATRPGAKERQQHKSSEGVSPTKGKVVAEGFTTKSRMKNVSVRNTSRLLVVLVGERRVLSGDGVADGTTGCWSVQRKTSEANRFPQVL